MDLISRDLVKPAMQHLHTAFQADCQQQYKIAVVEYMEGAPLLLQLAKEEGVSTQAKQFLKTKCQLYLDRIQAIKGGLDTGDDISPNTAVDRTQPNMEGLDEDSREAIQSWTELPFQCSLNEVKGASQVKEFLWTNVVLPLLCPGFPDHVTKVKRGILLYGLPGAGKTMLLCAVAGAVACPVVRVTACDLITIRYGAAHMVLQRLKDLFTWARQNQPSVLCLDDLDVLYNPDRDEEGSVTRMVREELILQLKPISADHQVIVIGATLKPWHLATDRGKLQRKFDRKFYLSLPDHTARVQIFSEQMAGINHEISEDDLERVGQLTSGFTGADISVLVRSCAMEPLRTLQGATHYRKEVITMVQNGAKITQEMMSPCDADAPGAVPITYEFLNPERVHIPPVTLATVERELAHMKPSCDEGEVQRMNEWA